MTGFSVDWLTMREPFDQAARAVAAQALSLPSQATSWRRAATNGVLNVVDLACGSGANLRELAPRLGGTQHWRLLDHDPDLLEAVPRILAEWAAQHGYVCVPVAGANGLLLQGPDWRVTVVRERVDLACGLDSVDLSGTHLLTCSALLDLVSEAWVVGLIQVARCAQAACLFALSVDGHTSWTPVDPDDQRVHELFTQHQRRDKGFGPAMGARAVPLVVRHLTDAGYVVQQAQSDWCIGSGAFDAAPDVLQGAGQHKAQRMQSAMIDGIAAAALAQAPNEQEMVHGWVQRRRALAVTGTLNVGHVDVIATLP